MDQSFKTVLKILLKILDQREFSAFKSIRNGHIILH